jgi:uncharacterized membrane protein
MEPADNAGDANFQLTQKRDRFRRLVLYASVFLVIGMCLFQAAKVFAAQGIGISGWTAAALLLLKLAGTCVAGLLLWYELDSQNPMLKKICKAGGQGNCNIVLKSLKYKMFGMLSLSEVGFVYFAGALVNILMDGLTPGLLAVLSWLNVIALPFTVFSVYYQWRIVKRWCVLCLMVQVILVGEFLINLMNPMGLFAVQMTYGYLNVLLFFTAVMLGWLLIKPMVKSSITSKSTSRQLTRLKRNAGVFESLLLQQRAIPDPTGLGITLGNRNGKYKLVKVCSPFCGPCALAHKDLRELLDHYPELQVQIVFKTPNLADDPAAKVVMHLLSLAATGNKELTRQALNDWYDAPVKDHKIFAQKYPVKEGLEIPQERLDAMILWCRQVGIAYTPTYFLQGHELPEIYHIEDVKYMLNS